MENCVISCDWFQVYVRSTVADFANFKPLLLEQYIFEKLEMSTRQFRDVYVVRSQDRELFATICCVPFSSILDGHGAIIKLDNRLLYTEGWSSKLINFMQCYGFQFKSISRVDICCDQNRFSGGMKPRRLISSFMNKRFLKNGQANYAIQGGSSLIDDYSYIKFGSRSSSVCSYMYDKTKEMRDKVDKPYIRERWLMNGIDDKQEVWRVEISIKADMQNLVSFETGEIFKPLAGHYEMQEALQKIFSIYAQNYFSFKINDKTKNKSRMKELKLWDDLVSLPVQPKRITRKTNSTKRDKTFLRRLDGLLTELRDIDDDIEYSIIRLKNEFAFSKNLAGYLGFKIEPFRKTGF